MAIFEFGHNQAGDAIDTKFVVEGDAYDIFSVFFNRVQDFLQYLTDNNMFSNAGKTDIHKALFRVCLIYSPFI